MSVPPGYRQPHSQIGFGGSPSRGKVDVVPTSTSDYSATHGYPGTSNRAHRFVP